MLQLAELNEIVTLLKSGGIILYPTEGVWGLGCDPFNQAAVMRLLQIKRRAVAKGLILITADWPMASSLILNFAAYEQQIKNVSTVTTWLFPATEKVPAWIRGESNKVAIRVTQHKIAQQITHAFGAPLVSTSANFTGDPAVKQFSELNPQLKRMVDLIIPGNTGNLNGATPIFDLITQKLVRK